MRFHVAMSKFGGPRVVRPGILVSPFRCVGRAPRCADTHRMGVLTALASERSSISSVIVPADGTRAATVKKLRYVCVFFGQLSDKPLLACIWSHGVRTPKRNGWWKIKRWAPSWRNAVVQLVNWLGGRRRKRFEFNRAALVRPEGERIV